MLFTNKESFIHDPKIYTILTALEKAHANKDHFSASILLTRLKHENITLVEQTAGIQPNTGVQYKEGVDDEQRTNN